MGQTATHGDLDLSVRRKAMKSGMGTNSAAQSFSRATRISSLKADALIFGRPGPSEGCVLRSSDEPKRQRAGAAVRVQSDVHASWKADGRQSGVAHISSWPR